MSNVYDDEDDDDSSAPRHRVEVANYIKEWRKYRKLTQKELAERSGLSRATINQVENGLVQYTQKLLIPLAQALSCRASDLIGINPQAENPVDVLYLSTLIVEFNNDKQC